MRFCCLGSGSGGNAFVVEHGTTTILVDCGFSANGIIKRMRERFLHLSDINAVLISHEHNDHVTGLKQITRKTSALEIYMTSGTAQKMKDSYRYQRIQAGQPFTVGDLQVTPITVPHDVKEPVQFIFSGGAKRLGHFTDIGHITPAIYDACRDLDSIVIECNYDTTMLANNTLYPQHLKDRIAGGYGHLANNEAAEFITKINHGQLQYVVAAHLSEKNNTAELVETALATACRKSQIVIANQTEGADWLTIG
ncbi:MAG: MBL fold metallo-hydrolase [Gammaproteobacteria bacterium WSBS_2016_MAG_OTU1]